MNNRKYLIFVILLNIRSDLIENLSLIESNYMLFIQVSNTPSNRQAKLLDQVQDRLRDKLVNL